MTIERLQLLRNVGQFDSVTTGAQTPLTRLSLIYAENGRGKTTLATILRSLGTGDTALIDERRRLGSAHAPHIVLASAGAPFTYQNGAWSVLHPDIAVFDDGFVAANVCSGIAIETAHKQNLHELILGARGVALNSALQGHVERIEEHNRALRLKGDAIPAAARGTLTVDAFCKLAVNPVIDARIARAEQSLSAAQAAGAIRVRPAFTALSLPTFDRDGLNALLARGLPALEADAAARVKAHLRRLGRDGETWVGEGMTRIAGASQDQPGEICPFCAQDLAASPLIRHYQAYFSDAYAELRNTINQIGKGINTTHGGDVPAAFERAVRVAVENREFWRPFTDIPDIDMDTAAIVRAWSAARDAVLTILRAKAAAPLDAMELSPECIAAIDAYDVHRAMVADLSDALLARNPSIAIVKEQAAVADIATLSDDLAKLTAVRTRHQTPTAALCDAYLGEKAAKKATEQFQVFKRKIMGHG